MSIKHQDLGHLRSSIDATCTDQKYGLPGTAVVVVGRDGEELFAHAAGKRGITSKEPMSLDTIFWIASCTKVITAIACMQLVEKGILDLDDGSHLERLCPELRDLKVLRPDGFLEVKDGAITLRMLLTHTAGFSYTFSNERLRDWTLPSGVDELSGRFEDMKQPLLFQPGKGWEYGIGIDWAGIAVERVTGQSLDEYLKEKLFEPLGIKDMSMIPNESMRSRMAHMHARDHDCSLRPRDHLLRIPLVVDLENKDEVRQVFNSGGGGIFATPSEYCKILAVLLNSGTCPRTGTRILREETVEEMFRNQIPEFPNFSRQGMGAAKPDLTTAVSELYPVEHNPPQGWGISFMQSNGGVTGRSKGTAHWGGLANLWWWCDRERGVAGMVCTQILPFGDAQVLKLWNQIETEVYKALG
ncbi:beta-lactamase family protein [Ilyonectria robusta]|uniref:beta-lactamase family protein n=1 Tax=Ilyonectria robusta TaxID=1079257 RepID=UPI001E8DF51F|nr:beta-lactamase family protein [Ilyonectria robusta]KAH8679316.1 beta-lactamase family protein [Ilyonectria robusta]